MTVYLETSALLRWLLGAARGEDVRRQLAQADSVVTSRLTETEARRALVRLTATGLLTEAQAIAARTLLAAAAARWALLDVDSSILERAALPFPTEPVRALDAIHLASALLVRERVDEVHVMSTDQRIRDNVPLLGLSLTPRAQ